MLHPKLSSIPCVEKSATTHVRIYFANLQKKRQWIFNSKLLGTTIREKHPQHQQWNQENTKKQNNNKNTLKTIKIFKTQTSSNLQPRHCLAAPPAPSPALALAPPAPGTGAAPVPWQPPLRRCGAVAPRRAWPAPWRLRRRRPRSRRWWLSGRPLNLGLEWKYVVKT